MNSQLLDYDKYDGIAGVDEVGRGAIAGPIVAAAVILPKDQEPIFKDSKKVSPKRRHQLYQALKVSGADIGIGTASPREIEKLNVHFASLIAMKRAIEGLKIFPDIALVDGQHAPQTKCKVRTIVKGDQSKQNIMAASILAKVSRDNYMKGIDDKYPEYGFKQHKGYPTKMHLEALKLYGVTSEHRLSFKPVKKINEPS